jgi:glyoxylase-like metal-dependent hydrolase (beta-lactamase superfamily II)
MRFVLAAIGAFAVSLQAQPATQLTPEAIGKGVYALIAAERTDDVDGNSTLIVGDRAAVIVDTHWSPWSARTALAEVRKLTSTPVRYIVNTHWHYDHLLGNQVYLDAFPGAQVVAHRETARIIDTWASGFPRRMTAIREKATSQEVRERLSTPIVGPSILVESRLRIDLGGRVVDLLHLGRGNTPGDLVVHVPDAGIAITGDLLVWPVPFAINSFPAAWIDTLVNVERLGARVLVPGHGPVQRDSRYLEQVKELLRHTVTETRSAVRRQLTLEETRAAVSFDRFRPRFAGDDSRRLKMFVDFWEGPAVERAWREARGEY